jgi:trigger factor
VTKGEGHQVTLKVEAGPEDMEEILERTYKDLSSKVKVPGFRKGKVPRAVIDSHLGVEYVRTEAVKNGIPTLYVLGVIESGIEPVSDPDINVLDLSDDGGVSFEAKVDVKPEIEVKDYKGIEVDRPDTEVTEEDLQRTLD